MDTRNKSKAMDGAEALTEVSSFGGRREKRGMGGAEALELVELLGRLSNISLADLAREQREELTPQQRMIEDLQNNKHLRRGLTSKQGKGRTPKPKPHWRILAKKRKAHYANYLKPRRTKEKARNLSTAEGWWKEQSLVWYNETKKKRSTSHPSTITKEEFCEVLYPAFEGRIPIFKRFDTTKGVSVDNLYIVDVDTGKVLFDGAEHSLRCLGYIL